MELDIQAVYQNLFLTISRLQCFLEESTRKHFNVWHVFGEVPAYRVGRFWRYRASELNEWLGLKSTGRIARVVSIKEKP